MNRVLILGGSGLVGKAIISEMNKSEEFQVYATYSTNPMPLNKYKSFKFNIEDAANISNILNTLKPHSVISCLRGDYDKQLTLHIKAAEYLKQNNGRLVFCSTANIFDNDTSKPHYEGDLQGSCTDYGQFKMNVKSELPTYCKIMLVF